MKPKIWRLNRSEIEALVKKDFTNLRWCPAAPEHGYTYRRGFANYSSERIREVLYARARISGNSNINEEPIVKEIMTRTNRLRGYRWVSTI